MSSSTLNWQAPDYPLYSSNPYRTQVDDDINFASINKDYYTTNTSYTPTLTEGLWYWRTKVKDISGNWSDWSTVWNFNLSLVTPTPTPTPTQTISPTPIPSPTPTIKPANSPTPTPLVTKFEISETPSTIDTTQSFSVKVNALNLAVNSNYYLKGAFAKNGSTNYFGKTLVGDVWVENNQTATSQYPITTDASGNWSGILQIMPDIGDSGFTGEQIYIFKIARYSVSGSGLTWSNQMDIEIKLPPENSSSGTPISEISVTTPATPTHSQTGSINLPRNLLASVAGTTIKSTPDEKVNLLPTQTKKRIWPFITGGAVSMALGIFGLAYYFKRR